MTMLHRDAQGRDRPSPKEVDRGVNAGFAWMTWVIAGLVAVGLVTAVFMGMSADRQRPPAGAEQATDALRVPPPGTGEVPGSRSPVQR